MFNGCELGKSPQGNKWEASAMISLLEDRYKTNWKNLRQESFDDMRQPLTFTQVRTGLLYFLPPAFFADFSRVQAMKDAIILYNARTYDQLLATPAFQPWVIGMNRLEAPLSDGSSNPLMGLLALGHLTGNAWKSKFSHVLSQVLRQNTTGYVATFEDITMDIIRETATYKYAKYMTYFDAKKNARLNPRNAALQDFASTAKSEYRDIRLNYNELLMTNINSNDEYITVVDYVNDLGDEGRLYFTDLFSKPVKEEFCNMYYADSWCETGYKFIYKADATVSISELVDLYERRRSTQEYAYASKPENKVKQQQQQKMKDDKEKKEREQREKKQRDMLAKQEFERQEQARKASELQEKERLVREGLERKERERQERDRQERERKERERQEKERVEFERQEKKKKKREERERNEREKQERERLERERQQAAKENQEKDKKKKNKK